MHLGMLGELQRVLGATELGHGGRHAQQLGQAEHNEARRPATAALAIDELEAQIDAVVAAKAGAFRVHDEHDGRAEDGVDVLVHVRRELVHLVGGFFHLALLLEVGDGIDEVLHDERGRCGDVLAFVRYEASDCLLLDLIED